MATNTTKTNWPAFRSLASYRAGDLPGDLIAGLTLAAIAIPEQMATARLGGFSPQIGFFAFIAGSLGFAALYRILVQEPGLIGPAMLASLFYCFARVGNLFTCTLARSDSA